MHKYAHAPSIYESSSNMSSLHDRRAGLNKVKQKGGGLGGFSPSWGLGPEGKGGPGEKPPEADAFL